MTATKKAAVSDSSIGVDVEQPLPYKDNEIITDSKEQFNPQATNNLTREFDSLIKRKPLAGLE